MFKGIALMGTLLALEGFAEECKGVALYSDGRDNGQMLESGRTFPEAPEWSANWGNMGGMQAPYIRLSGMKNMRDDWKGLLSFPKFPLHIAGGELNMKVRATQNVKFGVWLAGSSGSSSVYYVDLPANETRTLNVPVSNFGVSGSFEVSNIGVGIFQVPEYRYTTLFIDDVNFSCVKSSLNNLSSSSSSVQMGGNVAKYKFSNADAWSVKRNVRFLPSRESEFSAAYSASQRNSLIHKTNEDFLVSELEYIKIVNNVDVDDITASKSRLTWYDNMYSIVRNRLREDVIANPKQIYFEAEAVSAESDYTVIPLLVADLDYAYSSCTDSLCSSKRVMNSHLLMAGLPTSFVRGSKISLVLDPYFTVSKQRELPSVTVCYGGKCSALSYKGRLDLEFSSTGKQKIVVKLKSGNRNVEQNLFVEVK